MAACVIICPCCRRDWDSLGWALDRIAAGEWAEPWIVAFEYGGIGPLFEWRSERAVIAADVPRMMAMVQGAQPVAS
jgi:hypothetical protein